MNRSILISLCLLAVPFVNAQDHSLPGQLPTTAMPAALPSIIDKVHSSIARIEVRYRYETTDKTAPPVTYSISITGTGFVLDKEGHIGTASHVVDQGIAQAEISKALIPMGKALDPLSLKQEINIFFPENNGATPDGGDVYAVAQGCTANNVLSDKNSDVAVLSCLHNPVGMRFSLDTKDRGIRPPVTPAEIRKDHPREGEMISTSGFPLSIPVLVTNTGWLATSYFRDERDRSLYLGSMLINHGDSGAPVYMSANGQVIGIVTEYRSAPEGNSGLTVIVPVENLFGLLHESEPKH